MLLATAATPPIVNDAMSYTNHQVACNRDAGWGLVATTTRLGNTISLAVPTIPLQSLGPRHQRRVWVFCGTLVNLEHHGLRATSIKDERLTWT